MGKAKDGSNCYTRQNNAGGSYVTCEGQQKTNRKLQREISKLHGRTRVKVNKDEFNEARAGLSAMIRPPAPAPAPAPTAALPDVSVIEERIDTKVRQLDQRSWKSGRGKAKNPHTWIASLPDGRASTEGLMKVVSDYESGILKQTDVNTVIYKASQIILTERQGQGLLAGLQEDTQEQIEVITSQAHTQLGELFNAHVAESPGVVGMTSTMSSLGQATFDALLGAGFDVSAGISAAVAAREKDLWHFKKSNPNVLEFEGQFYLKLRNTPLTFQEFQDWTERSSDMGEDPIDDVIFDEWRRWTEFGEGDIFFAVDVVDISRNRVDVVDGQIRQRRIDEVVLGKRQSRFSDVFNIQYELKILPIAEDGEPLAPDEDTWKTYSRRESIPYGRMTDPQFNEEQRDKYFKPGDLGYKILLPAPSILDPPITRDVNDI